MNLSEVMERVCFLPEGESTLRFVPSASHRLLSECKRGGRGALRSLLAAFSTSQTTTPTRGKA